MPVARARASCSSRVPSSSLSLCVRECHNPRLAALAYWSLSFDGMDSPRTSKAGKSQKTAFPLLSHFDQARRGNRSESDRDGAGGKDSVNSTSSERKKKATELMLRELFASLRMRTLDDEISATWGSRVA